MSVFITLIAALVVFSAVIAIHEFGHFAVAKLCGIQVNEFSIGMGPALWKKIYKGTRYTKPAGYVCSKRAACQHATAPAHQFGCAGGSARTATSGNGNLRKR